MFIMFIFETERQKARAGEGQREGDTECEAGSRLRAVSTEPDTGLEPMKIGRASCRERVCLYV